MSFFFRKAIHLLCRFKFLSVDNTIRQFTIVHRNLYQYRIWHSPHAHVTFDQSLGTRLSLEMRLAMLLVIILYTVWFFSLSVQCSMLHTIVSLCAEKWDIWKVWYNMGWMLVVVVVVVVVVSMPPPLLISVFTVLSVLLWWLLVCMAHPISGFVVLYHVHVVIDNN